MASWSIASDYIKELLFGTQQGRSFGELCEWYSKLYGTSESKGEVL